MIGVAHPGFLWGLLGLTIPIAIHLLNRKEGKVTYLGSLRHFRLMPTRQFKSIRLNELVLLALRLLSVLLFVLLLCGIEWTTSSRAGEKWLLIEKGLTQNSRLRPVFDSLISHGYQARVLARDFPLLKDSASATDTDSYWALADALNRNPLLDVIVFSYNRAERFFGTRTALPPQVRWIPQDETAVAYALLATRAAHDSTTVRVGHSRAEETNFETVAIRSDRKQIELAGISDSIAVNAPDRLTIRLTADSGFRTERKIVEAALKAIRETIPIDIEFTLQPSDSADWQIVLADPDRSKSPATSRNTIRYQPMASPSLFRQTGYGQWALTQRLSRDIALKQNITFELLKVLVPAQAVWARAKKMDRRTVPAPMAWAPAVARQSANAVSPQPLDPLFGVAFLLLLVVERILSYSRKQ